MKDKMKIKLADKILEIIDELTEKEDPLYEEEDEDVFEDKPKKSMKPMVKIKIKGK